MSPLPSMNTTSPPLQTSFSKTPNTSSPASPASPSSKQALDASQDARNIVRLIQCSLCSLPLREPVTLPCGNTLCKTCIPKLHLRTNISYPATANRLQGFTCPFTGCGNEHSIGDCSLDVVLNKVMDVVRVQIEACRKSAPASQVLLEIEEKNKWSTAGIPSLQESAVQFHAGGRLAATYTMAETGNLPHDSEVEYRAVLPANEKLEDLDIAVLEQLKQATRSELDCQVCYGLFLDPLTTPCGHTLCRKCHHRVQDHSNLCPICRRPSALPPGVNEMQAPSNILLGKLLSGLFPQALAEREQTAKLEDTSGTGELDTSLFVCTLSFPSTPTFLHVFEPRYRLMIRRAVESGDRKFGMVLHNPTEEPQGELGPVPFYQYGTMLHIVNVHMMPDGRSIIETTGVSRFRVMRFGPLDGYIIGKVERVDDMSVAEEEAIEAAETSSMPTSPTFSPQDYFRNSITSTEAPRLQDLDTLSTQLLMDIGTSFVKRMREASAPWLHRKVVHAYGECPDDPALFPWWFASVIPTSDAEKYKMLQTTSVRERLKMCVLYAVELERLRWYDSLSSPCATPPA